jgi:hypothetical protein
MVLTWIVSPGPEGPSDASARLFKHSTSAWKWELSIEVLVVNERCRGCQNDVPSSRFDAVGVLSQFYRRCWAGVREVNELNHICSKYVVLGGELEDSFVGGSFPVYFYLR